MQRLPPELRDFVAANDLDVGEYAAEIERDLPVYVVLDGEPSFDHNSYPSARRVEFAGDLHVYEVPACDYLPNARPMCASSAFAAQALGVKPGDVVLDMACAPGGKFLCLFDMLKGDESSVLVGIDCSEKRLATMLGTMRRRAQAASSVSFAIVHGESCAESYDNMKVVWCDEAQAHYESLNKRVNINKSLRSTLRRICGDCTRTRNARMFNKILVDAPCTHDGSTTHVLKSIGVSPHSSFAKSPDLSEIFPLDCTKVVETQRAMLLSGFHKLTVGGTLIYSTCSFTRRQNEEVVDFLQSQRRDACVVPQRHRGVTQQAIRFKPSTDNTSGLFVCAISKSCVVARTPAYTEKLGIAYQLIRVFTAQLGVPRKHGMLPFALIESDDGFPRALLPVTHEYGIALVACHNDTPRFVYQLAHELWHIWDDHAANAVAEIKAVAASFLMLRDCEYHDYADMVVRSSSEGSFPLDSDDVDGRHIARAKGLAARDLRGLREASLSK